MKGGKGLCRDRSKISSNHNRIFFDLGLYPLSFFANTPFKDDMASFIK